MIRKTAIAVGVGTAVLLGAGGTAFAAESDTTPTTSMPTSAPTPSTTATPNAHIHNHAHRAFPGEYAQWTTFDKTSNAATVHDAIRGTVSAVSSTSLTVKAEDETTQTFAVGDGSTVHVKGGTKTDPATIGQVKVGDRAIVLGTGTGTGTGSLTATHIRDRGAPTTPQQ